MAAGVGIALVPRMAVEQARRDDVVAVPLPGRSICRRVEVAIPPGGAPARVTQALVDALVGAATVLDRPSERRVAMPPSVPVSLLAGSW